MNAENLKISEKVLYKVILQKKGEFSVWFTVAEKDWSVNLFLIINLSKINEHEFRYSFNDVSKSTYNCPAGVES